MNTNIYNPYVRRELELYHHGILGQRWGKRNGPPYPLTGGAYSSSEKKAGMLKRIAGGVKTGAGAVKRAATSQRTKKALSAVNKAAIVLRLKPPVFMTNDELDRQVERLKREKTYKRALRGKFNDISREQEKQGEAFGAKMMRSIGSDVVIPITTGLLTYGAARVMGGKDVDMVGTVLHGKAKIKGAGGKKGKSK